MSITGTAAVKAFRKKYGVLTPSLSQLRQILADQGYVIVEFNAVFNDPDVAAIIEQLELEEMIRQQRGFTYTSPHHRLVFVHEDLSEDEKRSVLLHEEGHVFCGHMEEREYIGRDVQQENEANAFAYRINNPTFWEGLCDYASTHRVAVWLIAAVIAAVLATASFFLNRPSFYITESGTKYHQAECIHIKGKSNVREITKEKLNSGMYTPCGTCLPQD